MISGKNIEIAYEKNIVIKDLDIEIKRGEILTILGTNGCGKSTLLKGISRVIPYKNGTISLENEIIHNINSKEFAKRLAFVSQNNEIPEDITVEEFVRYGRTPHKKWYELLNEDDEKIVSWAMEICKIEKFSKRKVMSLSGGERQKVWIAMVLAQKTSVLLLDEPTTYLDICHQFEIMELIKELNKKLGITIVMVLHDLNQASQYSDRVLVLKDGKKYIEGDTREVGENDLISTQLFAKSKDGFTFEKLSEPKIVAPERYCTAHFRDPKIWGKNGKYYMVLGGKKDNKGRVLFYQSEDFKNWKFVNEIYEENMGFMWECPDFFELDGKSILVFSPQGIGKEGQEHLAGYYMGDFDYETGKLTHKEFQVLDNGFELYAPQTFKDKKGRRIMIAWLVNHHPFPEENWTGMMTLPRELKIIDDKLYMYPVEEFNKYRRNLEIYKKVDTEFQIEME